MTHPSGSDRENVVIALVGEDATVEVRNVEQGGVRVGLQAAAREHLVDELLRRESIEIERVTVNRVVDKVPPVREEGDTTIVSVVEEVLFVERRLVLKEEIRLHRVRTTERHRETVVLRQQEAVVERVAPQEGGTLPLPPSPRPQNKD